MKAGPYAQFGARRQVPETRVECSELGLDGLFRRPILSEAITSWDRLCFEVVENNAILASQLAIVFVLSWKTTYISEDEKRVE